VLCCKGESLPLSLPESAFGSQLHCSLNSYEMLLFRSQTHEQETQTEAL